MEIFLTGATGYIGGTVAHKLIEAGHKVIGLARNESRAKLLEKRGIIPRIGTLENLEVLDENARSSDAVINLLMLIIHFQPECWLMHYVVLGKSTSKLVVLV